MWGSTEKEAVVMTVTLAVEAVVVITMIAMQ